MRTTMLFAATLLAAAPTAAQTSPYADEPPRDIAALSDEEVAGLLDGAGMGFALTAELNGVPGPRHALDLADSLALDRAQRALVADVFRRMQTEARRLGTEIVELERELNATFVDGSAAAADVERRTTELGRLYGRLRAVHLEAHLETAAILTPQQVGRYALLRGYAPDAGAADHSGHSAH